MNDEKQIFEETRAKQIKLAKLIVLCTLGFIGLIFSILGIVFISVENVTLNQIGIIFSAVGLFVIVLGMVLYFAIPSKFDYDKYKERVKKYGYRDLFEVSAKLAELEARIEALEKDKKL